MLAWTCFSAAADKIHCCLQLQRLQMKRKKKLNLRGALYTWEEDLNHLLYAYTAETRSDFRHVLWHETSEEIFFTMHKTVHIEMENRTF